MADHPNASRAKADDRKPFTPTGLNAPLWHQATPEQQHLLQRIAMQRERLKARAAAVAQARALRQSAAQVHAEAPLAERLTTFARLHPVALGVAAAAAVAVGPRKLARLGSVAMPWVLRWLQQQRR